MVQKLFREIINIAKRHKPIVIMMENLKGLKEQDLKEQKSGKKLKKTIEKKLNYKIASSFTGKFKKQSNAKQWKKESQ